jgi:RNA polymerase sigma factor (sigma-70 family)
VAARRRASLDGPQVEELIEAAIVGGPRGEHAWNGIVQRYAPAVWKALWTVRLSREDREDAFQATWLRALERLSDVREPAKLHVWLMVIARNEGIAVARRTAKLQLDEVPEGLAEPNMMERLELEEKREAVRSAVTSLPDQIQDLLRLLAVDPPLSYAEIDALLGWPAGGAAVRRHRAIKRLQAMPAIHRLRDEEPRLS